MHTFQAALNVKRLLREVLDPRGNIKRQFGS
jgi:hypothetical protein